MKCCCVIFVLFCCLALLCTAKDIPGEYRKAQQDCLDEMKLSAADNELVKSYKYLAKDAKDMPKNMYCFPLCFYKRLGYIDEKTLAFNRALLEENLMSYLKGDKVKVANTLDKCKDVKGADGCEKAFNNEVCFLKENGN